MNRRKFIRNSSLAGLSLSAFAGAEHLLPTAADFNIEEVTVDILQQKMQSGELTARKITEIYLKRIAEIDKNGPKINSVIEINPEALAIADAMDAERKAGKIRGALHGIPILIKDNISTHDKMMTTAGATALIGNIAAQDAFIVKKLREAGAVLLGKTNLSEWANFRSTRSMSGWSSRGRQTKNPYALDRNPSGSSAGSGSSVSANLCAVAIGTETDGSIVSPASHCGVVGIKPTVGLWSRSSIIPISKTQDTAGPMTRTVRDAAILLSALTGVDAEDDATTASVGKFQKDYTVFLNADALKGKHIGIEKSFLQGHEAVVALYKQAIEVLKQQGATIEEVDLLSLIRPLNDAEGEVLRYEFKDGVNNYLAKANAPVKTLTEVIAYNKKNEAQAMPYFKQEILEQCETKGGLDTPAYLEAVKKSLSAGKIIDDLMKTNNLDAIVGTTSGIPSLIDLINGNYNTGFSFSSPAAKAGYPHITVPMGKIFELPVGLSFIASAWEEGKIIGFAYAFEQATKKRTAPKFLKTVVCD
jgi:amidase